MKGVSQGAGLLVEGKGGGSSVVKDSSKKLSDTRSFPRIRAEKSRLFENHSQYF